jgi:hypothetical protein
MTRCRSTASVDLVRHADASDDAAPARRSFDFMAKPTDAVGNLDSEYCFFLSKEQLHPGATGQRGWCARADARRGRNDPCPFRSGAEWKGRHGVAAA